jgi:hypothetical protein
MENTSLWTKGKTAWNKGLIEYNKRHLFSDETRKKISYKK